MKKLWSWTIIFCLLMFMSCNLTTVKKYKHKNALVSIHIKTPQSSNYAIQNRSAVPSLPEEKLFWKISLTEQNNEELYFYPDLSTNEERFNLPVEKGIWTIKAEGYLDNSSEEYTKKVFEGSQTITVEEDGFYDVIIYVLFISQETGNVDLKIYTEDSSIEKLVIAGTTTYLDDIYFPDENGIIHIKKDNIPSGTYSPVLSFYENIGSSDSPVYSQILSVQEKINVRQNLTTNKWIKAGGTVYLESLEDNYAAFRLNKERIGKLISTSFYISAAQNKMSLLPYVNPPSDNNSGFWAAPFASLQGAFNKIIALEKEGLGDNSYTIYVDGIIENQTSTITSNFKENLEITIKPYKNESGITKAHISGNEATEPIITVGKAVILKLDDLKFSGRDIQVKNEGTLVFSGETQLLGGDIYLEENSIFSVEDLKTDFSQEIEQNYAAKIKCESPVENQIIIKSFNDEDLSEQTIKRFKLNNPGYYLAFYNGKGIVKSSYMCIKLPEYKGFDIKLHTQGDDKYFSTNEGTSICVTSPYENILFTAEIKTNDSDSEKQIQIPEKDIKLFLTKDGTKILSPADETSTNRLCLPENFNFPGRYTILIEYLFNDIIYNANILVDLL